MATPRPSPSVKNSVTDFSQRMGPKPPTPVSVPNEPNSVTNFSQRQRVSNTAAIQNAANLHAVMHADIRAAKPGRGNHKPTLGG